MPGVWKRAIAELPAPLGSIGTNGMFLPPMPLVGRGCKRDTSDDNKSKGPTVWYHNGSLVGFFSSVHILPETGAVIVVLVNSVPKNDAADWVGQLLLEAWLDDCSKKNDYVSLAEQSAAAYDDMWARWPDLDVLTYVFHFGTDEKGHIKTLRWEHDPDVPGGETFVKKSNETLDHRVRTGH